MLAKRRFCNEFVTQARTLVSTTRIIRTWWVFIDLKMNSASDIFYFLLAWTYVGGTPFHIDIYYSAWSIQRGIHDIHRSFAFKNSPGFIFHDSPGFETGDERQLQEVLSFMEKKAKSTEVDDQLHAIWSVSLSQPTYWPLTVSSAVKGFVLFWTRLGLCYHWKRHSLRRRGQEKVSITPSFKFKINILQYPSSRSLPSSMTWWLRSMTWIEMTMSTAKKLRKFWIRGSENHCTGMPFHHVQMSASKASAG